MNSHNPILSVITINYNNYSGLQKTIESVINQTNKKFEYLIIDGGSYDASIAIIESHSNKINYWISEKDNGIYDAMNKGILKSNGDYLLFLNSGDTFYNNNVVEHFYNYIQTNCSEIIYGSSQITNSNKKSFVLTPPNTINLSFWYRNTLNHQAVFIHKTIFKTFGLYNLSFKICADFELFLKAFIYKPEMFGYIPHTICSYTEDGFSAATINYDKMIFEKETILKTHLSKKNYTEIRGNYEKTLPLKQRVLKVILRTPIISKIFTNTYPLFFKTSKD